MNYRNRKNKKLFTDLFTEFIFERKLDVQTALYILSKKSTSKNQKIVLAARNLQDVMKNGGTLSYALKVCPYINFDSVYVSFIRFAERSGNLCEVMNFLRSRCKREEENEGKVVEAAVYPVFVIILSVVVVVLFFYYFSSVFDSQLIDIVAEDNLFGSLFLSFAFLIVFCVVSIIWLKKTLGVNKLYEAFLAVGFLVKGGECLSVAVGDAVEAGWLGDWETTFVNRPKFGPSETQNVVTWTGELKENGQLKFRTAEIKGDWYDADQAWSEELFLFCDYNDPGEQLLEVVLDENGEFEANAVGYTNGDHKWKIVTPGEYTVTLTFAEGSATRIKFHKNTVAEE